MNRVEKIPGIIFSEGKYRGIYSRYLLKVNTFDQGVLGIIPIPEYYRGKYLGIYPRYLLSKFSFQPYE